MSGNSNEVHLFTMVLLILIAVCLVAGVAFIMTQEQLFQGSNEARIGALIVLGVSLLLALLFIVAAGFKMMGLANRDGALGLPEGSIRALIALLLILIFIMMGIYLYRSVGYPSVERLKPLSASQVAQLPADRLIASYQLTTTITTYNVVYQVSGNGAAAATTVTLTNVTLDQVPPGAAILTKSEVGTIPTYEAVIRIGPSDKSTDLAQQLLTTLGTLVVAVAGFYFGSQAVAAARGEAAPSSSTTTSAPVTPSPAPTSTSAPAPTSAPTPTAPKSEATGPKPEALAPKPEVPAPKPEPPAPKPETPASKPEVPALKPEVPAPKPEASALKPEIPAPKPEPSASKPETPAPKPEVPALKPEVPAPKPEASALKPEVPAPKPEPSAPQPGPSAAKVEPAAPKPEVLAPKLETPAPRPGPEPPAS
jgi:hypothetical protein